MANRKVSEDSNAFKFNPYSNDSRDLKKPFKEDHSDN